MIAISPGLAASEEIIYPSADGEPVAETYIHFYAISTTLETLKQYLTGKEATVLANQFLYYAQGFPKIRVAPDVMVIFDVTPGGRDNYKIWEERSVPKVIFEMTSKSTKDEDKIVKKNLYEQLGVQEYWLFDPKGEWIPEKLIGYGLQDGIYQKITDNLSQSLQLRLEIDDHIIAFYRLDNGEKLLIPDELLAALKQETQLRQEAENRANLAEQKLAEMEGILQRYRAQFGEIN
ncbi:MAG TPA: Uma2 family endonuclease [Allocoleopsis sp.]